MTEELFSLAGRKVLVTGGTRGIGRAISLRFARAGAVVLANYVRDEASAEELKQAAGQEGLKLDICRADLTGENGVERLMASVDELGSTLHGLVHCAATGVHLPIEQMGLRHFDWTMALNTRAFFNLVHRLLPRFAVGGSILAISSEGAVRAVPHYTLVGASKGSLESMVRHMSAELAGRGIRVNALAPGAVKTDAWKALPDAEHRLGETIRKTPLGRLVSVEEIAAAAQFLCSDAAAGIVGHTLVVDGGCRIMS
jgi:NAD(P)-dependent dehydrogenase (short-subunit alcohol dehydrogenase family)